MFAVQLFGGFSKFPFLFHRRRTVMGVDISQRPQGILLQTLLSMTIFYNFQTISRPYRVSGPSKPRFGIG